MFEPKSFDEINKRAALVAPENMDDLVEGYYRAVVIGDLLSEIVKLGRRGGVTDPAVAYQKARQIFSPANDIAIRILTEFETVTV